MSWQRLLLLVCLGLLCLSVVQFSRASGDLYVKESKIRVVPHIDSIEVLFAIENPANETRTASVRLELLDTNNDVLSEIFETRPVAPGSQTLRFNLPPVLAKLTKHERRELLWYRLRYRMVETVRSSMTIHEGIISLSEIMPDIFEIRVASAHVLRTGGRYEARVQAVHPFTHRPAAGVQVKGEITFEYEPKLKPTASAVTDKEGYALLKFVMPPELGESNSGDLKVVGTRDGVVAEAEGEVMVDNLIRTVITTDKVLYQPGQVMHIRALMFGPTKRALVNNETLIRIVDPENVSVFVSTGKTSRFGVISADWQIPDNVRLGDYRIWVDGEGHEYETPLDVRISRYELPSFSVSVEPDRGFYLSGQNAKVKVRADYLFGQPVKRGLVRVVEETGREWNFREQRWVIDEGDEFEGETDAQGSFEANVDLASEHEDLADSEYNEFKDLTYSAYFTDPTTNRTEQRRFSLRITKEPIHVYIIKSNSDSYQSRDLPLRFYVSTYYADGSPARCKVNISLTGNEKESAEEKGSGQQRTIRTNRYGLAKTSIRLAPYLADRHSLNMKVRATDANGRAGSAKQRFYIDDDDRISVDTEKTLYRTGEPIVATITTNLPDQELVVELAKDLSVLRSESVRLRNGRATVSFPYTPNLTGRITIATYPDFAETDSLIGLRTILYPGNPELNLNVKTSQAIYRPGDEASVRLRVRASDGQAAESALGIVVSDKAVDERMRTDSEFGAGRYRTYNETLTQFLGLSEQLSGVTFRDLQRLDMTKLVPTDLDLLAEVLLNQYRSYYPTFFRDEEYETDLAKVYGSLISPQMIPVYDALNMRYQRTGQYPSDEKTLRQFLQEGRVDFQMLLDPWGINYRADFFVQKRMDVFTLSSAGADKQFGTDDDFIAFRMNWDYFIPIGKKIQWAVNGYHKRTKLFIRDRETLRQALIAENVALDQLRDRWGQPYRFDFKVKDAEYVIEVNSGGDNKRFSDDPTDSEDDFTIWTAEIDYFDEPRQQIEKTLSDKLTSTGKFPQSDLELREALRDSALPFETLRDPWDRAFYAVFKIDSIYTDRIEVENRAAFGNSPATQTRMLPVTRTTASVTLRSAGADGQEGTADDFSVAIFSRVIKEEARGETQLKPVDIVISSTTGVIHGVVMDASGAVIPDTKIRATRSPDIHRYHVVSDENGGYVLKDLPPGLYEVQFERVGFVTTTFTEVTVRVGSFTQINTVLQAAQVTETVTVTAAGPEAINTTEVSHSIQGRAVQQLDISVITKSGGTTAQISTPRLREYFPETLLWQPSVETDGHGRAEVKFKLADNITTWKMAVIGSTEDGRIGTAETEFKAFQPFFVEHDPPRILTEGDEISLPVVVRNYLDRLQKVDLEIKTENWFSLLGPARKQTSVAAGNAARETFDFRVVSSGDDRPQRITAIANNANDAIEKPVTVHPDGEEHLVTEGDLLLNSAALEVNLPENVIPNSMRAELKIYPNLMAHVIESVEGIMARPYGCAEQTISSTYPSLLLLRNYKQTGEDFAQRARAQRYLNLGYTRLLNYRNEGGGFGYFSDGSADAALTAYALRFLTDAADVIEVDREVIRKARQWLMELQENDGSWAPHQFAVNDETKHRKRALLTAYVVRVLVATEAKLFSETNDAVAQQERTAFATALKRAVEYVGQRRSEIDEPYLLASYALALIDLRDVARAKPVIEKLRTLAHAEDDSMYWSLETNTPFYGWGIAGRIETTALVVQALNRYCGLQEGNCADSSELIKRGMLFLFKYKDGYGVWYSTQATVGVLDTMLTLFAANKTGRDADVTSTAQIEINGRVVQTVTIPETRRLASPITVPIRSFLSSGKNRIVIKRPDGNSFSSVHAIASYYAPWNERLPHGSSDELRLFTTFDKTEGKIGDSITCRVEVERVGFKGFGMMIAEIGLPPGADVDRSSLEQAQKDLNVMQYDVLPDRILLYLWPRAGGTKLDIKFRPRFGLAAKTAPSIVYDYYNPESRLVVPPVKFRIN